MIQTRKEFQDHKFAGLTYFIALFGDSQTILNGDFPFSPLTRNRRGYPSNCVSGEDICRKNRCELINSGSYTGNFMGQKWRSYGISDLFIRTLQKGRASALLLHQPPKMPFGEGNEDRG